MTATKSKLCLFFHKWSKWRRALAPTIKGQVPTQVKFCMRPGCPARVYK